MDLAVDIKNIHKSYKSGDKLVKAIEDVSFFIKKGEIFGLLGPNGAGKTTSISILAGIVESDSGSVKIFDLDIKKEIEKIKSIMNVGSGFSGVIYALSAEEALMYYSLLYNIENPKQKIEEVIKITNLTEARKQSAEDLSSGMKQRFMIAKALLNDPKLLILDEPTVGLDVEAAVNIRQIIKNLKKEGRSILLTTHNMFEAEELCDRIAFINRGKIVITGTPEEIKKKIVKKQRIEVNCSDAKMVTKIVSKHLKCTLTSDQTCMLELDDGFEFKEILKLLSSVDCQIFSVTLLEPDFEETYLKIIKGD